MIIPHIKQLNWIDLFFCDLNTIYSYTDINLVIKML